MEKVQTHFLKNEHAKENWKQHCVAGGFIKKVYVIFELYFKWLANIL